MVLVILDSLEFNTVNSVSLWAPEAADPSFPQNGSLFCCLWQAKTFTVEDKVDFTS